MAEQAIRTFQDYQTEGTLVRDVSVDMLLLEPDRTPLYVLTNNSKRKKSVYNPVFEWPEDQDLPMLGTVSNGTTALSSVATAIPVQDVTIFGVNDMVQAPTSGDIGTGIEEVMLITAVTIGTGTPSTTAYQIGAVAGTITVTRGFAATTPGTIGATQSLRILATAATEGGAIQTPRSPYVTMKTSACQIFEQPIQITLMAAASRTYYDRNERARLQMMAMRRAKLEIEDAGIFGVFSQSVNGTSTRLTSMGVRSVISPFVTDMGGTATYQSFLQANEFTFRFGSPQKLLIASPLVKTSLDYFAAAKQLVKPDIDLFGVSLKKFVTSNGTFLLANNFNMGDYNAVTNYSYEALAIDLPSLEFCPLSDNGISCDTQLKTNYDTTNPKLIKDLVYTQAGWRVRHPARHARFTNWTAFQ